MGVVALDTARVWVDEDDVRRYLKLPASKDSDTLRMLINGAARKAESHLGRKVLTQDVTEFLDGTGTNVIQLKWAPVISITSLAWVDEDGVTIQAVTAFWTDLDLATIRLKSEVAFTPNGPQSIKVVYKAGWTKATVPGDITAGLMMLVAKWHRDQDKERDDIQGISLGGQTVTYSNDPLPRKVKDLWDPWVWPMGAA